MKTVMKKMFCLLLVAVLLISAVPAAFATETCPEGEHTWNDGVVEVEATCENNGRKVFTCTTCGATTNQYPEPKGHTEVIVPAVAATCTTAGQTEGKYCSVCNTVLVATTVVPKVDHVWDTGTVQTPATCSTAGTMVYGCTTCPTGDMAIKTATIPATGQHTWGTATCTTSAKCTTPGCNAVNGTELGHTWVLKTNTAATCTAAGSDNYECGVCGATKSDTIPSLGHNIGSEGICLRPGCGYKETTKYEINFYLDYNNNTTPVTKLALKGRNIYDLYTPSRTGYKLEGWYTVSGNRVSETATVNGDSAYYAKWTQLNPHEVYVKFYTHGNTKTVVKYVDLYNYAQDGVITLTELETIAKDIFKARDGKNLYVYGPFSSTQWDIYCGNSSYRNTKEKIDVSQDATTVIHAMVRNVKDSSSSSSAKADSTNPKTGDMIMTPVIVLGASVTCLAVLFYLNKKRAY